MEIATISSGFSDIKICPNGRTKQHYSTFEFIPSELYNASIGFEIDGSIVVKVVSSPKRKVSPEITNPFLFRFHYDNPEEVSKIWSVASRRVLIEKSGYFI